MRKRTQSSLLSRVGILIAGFVCVAILGHSTRLPSRPIALSLPTPQISVRKTGSPSPAANSEIASRNDMDLVGFHKLAKRQLEQISHAIVSPDKHVTEWAESFSPDFTCTPLRCSTELVFQQGPTSVWRAVNPAAATSQADAQSESRDVQASLRGLADLFDGATELNTKIKIFRVQPDATLVHAIAYFQASGVTIRGRVQVNAIWDCQWEREGDAVLPRLRCISVRDYEEVIVEDSASPWFADCTEAVLSANESFAQLLNGVNYWSRHVDQLIPMYQTGHNGVAVGDANNDGLDDLYVCQQNGLPNRLYLQNPDGTASDGSSDAGVDILQLTRSALFCDLDNDGDQDLIVAIVMNVAFLKNDGRGRFVERARIPSPSSLYSLASADYDNDGLLDVYVCGRSGRNGQPIPYHDANNGGPNMLLRNLGSLQFQNVTERVGLDQNNRRFSLAAAWEDFDNDGDQDLYVSNDYGRNNLYRNDDGNFVDVAAEAGVEDIAAGMSVSWADYNHDGHVDLYVGNMFSAAGGRLVYQPGFQSGADDAVRGHFQRHARGNTLFENLGDGRFRDRSVDARVTMGRWAWGSMFVDINNDGSEDLIVANGFMTNQKPDDL